ncbi:MAG: hypothetical protein FJZ78_06435 [Bacteroidetes bacterium]|nr:hypothetical protein [Bacteroidota bacterium]
MAKLKNIIKQLSEKDFQAIYESLITSNAEKSAYLMKSLRDLNLSDSKIMVELDVNANAYYTLRSRLNQKIEEHLLQQMESPRTDILKKVANINEVLFTKKRTISIATLKKIEKELIDYDLANELTVVYKQLKKLHLNSSEQFTYSQLYNRHIAYTLAVDKAEHLVAEYFKKFSSYYFSASPQDKMSLNLQLKEMHSVAKLYQSHRLYIFSSCINVFHQLFVESDPGTEQNLESVEDIFSNVQKVFDNYPMDPVYYHLRLVFEFLKLEYYNHYRVFKQAEKYYEEINEAATNLLMNYGYFTFPPQFLISKLSRSLRLGVEMELYAENENLFRDIELDGGDLVTTAVFDIYRALSNYYVGKYDESAKIINQLLNSSGLKNYPFVLMEIKALLALQYCMQNDFDLFNQLSSSIQRQIRLLGKDACENIVLFLKMLKYAASDSARDKAVRIKALAERIGNLPLSTYFSPTSFIRMDDAFVKKLCAVDFQSGS